MIARLIGLMTMVMMSAGVFAQEEKVINSVHIYPPFPTTIDSVYLIISTKPSAQIMASAFEWTDQDSLIDIKVCYQPGYDSISIVDTINIGIRPIGLVDVKYSAYMQLETDCYAAKTDEDSIQFQVVEFLDNQSPDMKSVFCYPYPYVDELLNIESPFKITKIEVMSGTGKYHIKHQVNLKQKLLIDLGELTQGGYYLTIYDEMNAPYRVRFYVR